MAQAIMDPDEVRRFAEQLKRFTNDVHNAASSLQARYQSLGDTWQDQEYEKFSEEFGDTMKAIRKFIEVANRYSPYLMRKAQRVEDYLKQR